MSSDTYSLMKQAIVAATLLLGASSAAVADDSSMARFGGDSWAYFNSAPIDKSPSAWRQSNAAGVPEGVFQSYSAPGEAWHLNKPVFASTTTTFQESHPTVLTERDFQALSSEAPAWHVADKSSTAGEASTEAQSLAQITSAPSFKQRLANFFHVTAGQVPAAN